MSRLNGTMPQILGPDGSPFRRTQGRPLTASERFNADVLDGPESGLAVPHILTFASILSSAYRNYYHGQYDEAMRYSREDAQAMRQDAWLRSLVDERKLAVASLKWHLEIDNPKDAYEKAMRDGLTQCIRSIPRWWNLTWSGLEAIWYGRAGDQFDYIQKEISLPAMPTTTSGGGLPTISVAPSTDQRQMRKAIVMRTHQPVEGDKLDYDFDGNPYVLITPLAANYLIEQGADVRVLRVGEGVWAPQEKWTQSDWTKLNEEQNKPVIPRIKARDADIGYTTIGGRALFLKGSWRQRYRIHTHEVLDSSFFEPWKAGSIHGVGVRSVVFWYWWLRQEFLANVADWCARTGLGIKLWYYEQGNNASKQAVLTAAKDQSDRVNIAVPYDPNSPNRPGVDIVEMSGTGADTLRSLVKDIEWYIERYIVGQSMSAGSDDQSAGFGDRGRADFAKNTKNQITKGDAARLGDTNTTDIVDVFKRWVYPEMVDVPCRMVYEVDDPDIEKRMKAVKDFVDMGGRVAADQLRAPLGLSRPGPDDETVGGLEALQQKQATSGHIKPPESVEPSEQAPSAENREQPSAENTQSQGAAPERYEQCGRGQTAAETGCIPQTPDELASAFRKSSVERNPQPNLANLQGADKPLTEQAAKLPLDPQPNSQAKPDFNKLLQESEPVVQGVAHKWEPSFRQAGKGMDANDLAQEARIALWNARDKFDPSKGSWSSFANIVSEHAIGNLLRGKAGRLSPLSEEFDTPEQQTAPADKPLVSDLDAAISKLPEQSRAIMERRRQGQTTATIAQDLGMAHTTVRTIASRAAQTLRGMIPHEGLGEVWRYLCEREQVHQQLEEDYPEDALLWLRDAKWTGPRKVPWQDVDYSNASTWRASHEPDRVKKFKKRIMQGKMKPVILIKKPGRDKLIVTDGHHRSLAYRKLDRPLMAWVAEVPENRGDWDQMHAKQFRPHEVQRKQEESPERYVNTDNHGGVIPEKPEAAQKFDLITLPQEVQGTNCFNCKFIKPDGDAGFCTHPEIQQHVTARNCCAAWDNQGAERHFTEQAKPERYAYGPRHHPQAAIKGAVIRLKALAEHHIDGDLLDAEMDSIAREFTADELREIAEGCDVKPADTKSGTVRALADYIKKHKD